jgi:hypothetical protein
VRTAVAPEPMSGLILEQATKLSRGQSSSLTLALRRRPSNKACTPPTSSRHAGHVDLCTAPDLPRLLLVVVEWNPAGALPRGQSLGEKAPHLGSGTVTAMRIAVRTGGRGEPQPPALSLLQR